MITQEKQLNASGRPHYLLLADTRAQGHWQFSLEPLEHGEPVEVSDCEPDMDGERLELLAVIRGLEALDQPSRVTLVTTSRYVARGIRFGMEVWRRGGWCWERFGRVVPVKNHDLWERLDGAMGVHEVRCKHYRLDAAHVGDAADGPSVVASGGRGRSGADGAMDGAMDGGDRPPLVKKPHFARRHPGSGRGRSAPDAAAPDAAAPDAAAHATSEESSRVSSGPSPEARANASLPRRSDRPRSAGGRVDEDPQSVLADRPRWGLPRLFRVLSGRRCA